MRLRLPERLDWTPKWEGEIENWTRKECRKQAWKVQPLYDEDDLFQEAFFKFAKCVDSYPDVVEAPHFMRLYQTSVRRHILDLARRRTRVLSRVEQLEEPEQVAAEDQFVHSDWKLMLEDAPELVRRIVKRAPREGGYRHYYSGRKETTGEMLARIAGGCSDPRKARATFEVWIGWRNNPDCREGSRALSV